MKFVTMNIIRGYSLVIASYYWLK